MFSDIHVCIYVVSKHTFIFLQHLNLHATPPLLFAALEVSHEACLYVSVCVSVCMCVHTHVFICTYMHTYIYIHMYALIHLHEYVHIPPHLRTTQELR